MRLNKFISASGFASRRAADALIAEGKVKVNGLVVQELGIRVSSQDSVEVNGHQISIPSQRVLIAFHKPLGCICSQKDPQNRPTVYDYLSSEYQNLKYVGRLDFWSRGLLLFTNDGELLYALTHPKFQIPRTYWVKIDPFFKPEDIEKVKKGVDIGDGEWGQARSVSIEEDFVELVLTQGKNREIRRMMDVLGYKVLDLLRVAYAGVDLGSLKAGESRLLMPKEMKNLETFGSIGASNYPKKTKDFHNE